MSKLGTALWKGLKHGLTAGASAAAATFTLGQHDPKAIGLAFVYGFLAGMGINAQAIKNAPA